MDNPSMIKCPKCKAEYQNFLATQLKAELAEYKNAEKFVSGPPHDQVCCGCVAILRKQLAAAEKENQELKDLMAKGFNKAAEAMLKPLKADLTRYKDALEKIGYKAWDYTSPPMTAHVQVFAGTIHNMAKQALNPKEKPK